VRGGPVEFAFIQFAIIVFINLSELFIVDLFNEDGTGRRQRRGRSSRERVEGDAAL